MGEFEDVADELLVAREGGGVFIRGIWIKVCQEGEEYIIENSN